MVGRSSFFVVVLTPISIAFMLLVVLQQSFSQQKFKGYPLKRENIDLLPGFIHPPKGYGNVPFYWWNGDSLNRDRLREQLDMLSESATDGFAVSYIRLHPWPNSIEMAKGYGLYGRTEPGCPKVFSEE